MCDVTSAPPAALCACRHPRCHTASLWARIEKIYYASTYEDVMEYGK